MKDSKRCLEKALNLARQMLKVADEGDAVRHDIGCGVLFGTLRDCAYKVRSLAETEILAHKNKTVWRGEQKEFLASVPKSR